MIELITQNKDLISLITIVVGGLFIGVKWLDTRNREIREKRYENYIKLINVISGKRPDSSSPSANEQVAAIWLLLEYKDYYDITIKVFNIEFLEKISDENWKAFLLPQIKQLIKEIQ